MPHLRRLDIVRERFPGEERYPFNLRVVRETRSIDFSSPVTMFAGENGTGKSTILEALCLRCGMPVWKYDEGRRRSVRNPWERKLHEAMDLCWEDGPVPGSFFSSRIFQDFTEILDEWAAVDPAMLKYFGGRPLVTQSHGQSLLSYFGSRYSRRGLYLLDEPETALSPRSQLSLIGIITAMAGAGHAQFVIATHSPLLMACPGAEILSFDELPLRTVRFDETDHFVLTRDFLNDPDRFLKALRAD